MNINTVGPISGTGNQDWADFARADIITLAIVFSFVCQNQGGPNLI